MQPFKQILDYPKAKKSQIRIWVVLAVLWILLGAAAEFFAKDFWNYGTAYVAYGILALVVAFVEYKRTGSKYFVELNSDGIKFRNRGRKIKSYSWTEIERIVQHPIEIELILKNKSTEHILLENLFYKEVINFKSKLKEFAHEAGLKVY